MSIQEEMLEILTKKLKEKSYNELFAWVNEVQCFKEQYKGKSFIFEVHVTKSESDNELKVMVECAKDAFLLNHFGIAKYFSIDKDGEIKNIQGF